MFRAFFALSVSIAIMPFLPVKEEIFLLSIFNAVVFGLAIGLMTRVIIAAVETAAQWMSIQIGFPLQMCSILSLENSWGQSSVFYEMFTISSFFLT